MSTASLVVTADTSSTCIAPPPLTPATLRLQAKQQLETAVQQAGQQANQRQASLAGAAEELQAQLAAAREAADQSRRELESVKKEVAVAVNEVLLQVGGWGADNGLLQAGVRWQVAGCPHPAATVALCVSWCCGSVAAIWCKLSSTAGVCVRAAVHARPPGTLMKAHQAPSDGEPGAVRDTVCGLMRGPASEAASEAVCDTCGHPPAAAGVPGGRGSG